MCFLVLRVRSVVTEPLISAHRSAPLAAVCGYMCLLLRAAAVSTEQAQRSPPAPALQKTKQN